MATVLTDLDLETPVDLAKVAHDLRLTVSARTRDTGRWHAWARRFASDRRLILSVPAHDQHVWVGNGHAQRLWGDDTPEYAMVRSFLARNGEAFGLSTPRAVRVSVRTYGPAPSPDLYGIERVNMGIDVDAIRDRAIGGHARRVTHWTAVPEGTAWRSEWRWVANTLAGDRVYFDPAVAAAHADAAWVEVDGLHRPASAWDQAGRCIGVFMPVRNPDAVWQ